jgi:hypothetical protein
MNLYVYDADSSLHIATLRGEDQRALDAAAEWLYPGDEYAATYSPAWGFSGGLIASSEAEVIDIPDRQANS